MLCFITAPLLLFFKASILEIQPFSHKPSRSGGLQIKYNSLPIDCQPDYSLLVRFALKFQHLAPPTPRTSVEQKFPLVIITIAIRLMLYTTTPPLELPLIETPKSSYLRGWSVIQNESRKSVKTP